MGKRSKPNQRLYAPEKSCHKCNYKFQYHLRHGCNMWNCDCRVKNISFKLFLNVIAKTGYLVKIRSKRFD